MAELSGMQSLLVPLIDRDNVELDEHIAQQKIELAALEARPESQRAEQGATINVAIPTAAVPSATLETPPYLTLRPEKTRNQYHLLMTRRLTSPGDI